MAELLVRVVDKRNLGDPILDAQLSKRGDVIAVCPDGWSWGAEELSNPDWRIIIVPGTPREDFVHLTKPRLDNTPVQGALIPMPRGAVLRKFDFNLNLDHATLTPPDKAWLADSTRADPMRTIPAARLLGLVRKP